MTPADEIVLKALEPFMSVDAYAYVVQKTTEVGGIRNLTDTTALHQFAKAKQSFGGDKSAAGSYAASIRWSKNKKPESGGASAAGGATAEPEKPRYANAFNDEEVLADTETSINSAYDKSGFGAEKGDALAAVEGTRKTLYEAQQNLKFGVPVETVRSGLVKESRRLKSLSTRTRKKGEELQLAEGGPKKDANGKSILTRASRFFTDAQVIKNMSLILESTASKLGALKS